MFKEYPDFEMYTMEAMERAVLFFPSCLCCTLILKEIVNLALWKMFQKIGMLWRISDLRIESAQRSFKSMHFKTIEIRVHLATFPLVPVFDDGFLFNRRQVQKYAQSKHYSSAKPLNAKCLCRYYRYFLFTE